MTWEIAGGRARSPQLPGVAVAGDPFAGVVGVAPSHELMDDDRAARAGARRCRRSRRRPPAGDGDPCRGEQPACARSRRARSAATSTSASSSRARASRLPGPRRGSARLGRRPALRPGRRRGLRHRRSRWPAPSRSASASGRHRTRLGCPTFETPDRPGAAVVRDDRHRARYADGHRRGRARRAARDDRLPRGEARRRRAPAAYALCSVAVDLRISEVVDIPYPLVSALLPLDIFESS